MEVYDIFYYSEADLCVAVCHILNRTTVAVDVRSDLTNYSNVLARFVCEREKERGAFILFFSAQVHV